MEPTKEQLQRAAEWCGWKIVQTDNPDNPNIDFGDGSFASIDYPLTPDGREAMERAIVAKGGDWTVQYVSDMPEGEKYLANISTDDDDVWKKADTPAAALVLAICQLAEKEKRDKAAKAVEEMNRERR